MTEVVPVTSEISIDCRSALWSRGDARYITTALQEPIDYADDYVRRVLGVQPTVETVAPYLAWRKRAMGDRGLMVSEKKYILNLPKVDVMHKKLHRMDQELTVVSVHEMIHCTRLAAFPQINVLMENIATEGLAYFAQAWAEHDMFDVPLEKTVLIDNLDGEQLLGNLHAEPRRNQPVKSSLYLDRDFAREWMIDPVTKESFSWAHRLGIWCVRSLIYDYECDFTEVMAMPAEEILAVV